MMQFHLLSLEGPDDYARAGGVATRVTALARALAEAGHESHVWFIGDPELPGYERHGEVHLHRWCGEVALATERALNAFLSAYAPEDQSRQMTKSA